MNTGKVPSAILFGKTRILTIHHYTMQRVHITISKEKKSNRHKTRLIVVNFYKDSKT